MEYLMAAAGRCRFLWIGLTQYDIRHLRAVGGSEHRGRPDDNPLTYVERVEILSRALKDEGLKPERFAVHPFPLEEPEKLPDFLPLRIPIFTTVYDDWNRFKIEELRRIGFRVEVLWERETKVYAGSRVRALIEEGSTEWQRMVPPATKNAVATTDLRERLLQIKSTQLRERDGLQPPRTS
jgi:nicotinamide mononucleotide adenylyltransferase